MTAAPIERLTDAIAARGARTVHVAIPDVDGGLRERRLPLASVPAALGDAASFCNVLHEWDVTDCVHGPGPFVGEGIAVDPASLRGYPFEPAAVWLLADFTGPHRASSPRELLNAQINRATQLGFTPRAAFEFEWLVFDEDAKSLRAKRWSQPSAFAPDNRCWDAQSAAINAEVVAAQQAMLAEADIGVFGLGMELGAGCMEATLLATDALRAADDAAFFKLASRAFFRRRQQTACFMAQSDAGAPGLSGHIHLSLVDAERRNLFAAPAGSLSPLARYFVGGVLKLLPALTALPLHTVNAYRRLSPGNWAPRTPTWSFGGYTTAIRAVSGEHPQARLEFRIPGADVNPWLGLAMFLGAGLWGIEHRIDLPPVVTGDGRTYTAPDLVPLPHDLFSAAQALYDSREARAIFGSAFIDAYCASRRHEFDSLRRAVSAEEKARYFEIA
jgi:glutamine synthetase